MKHTPRIPRTLSAQQLEREIKALTRLFNQGLISAGTHKNKVDELVKRYE